MVWAAVLMFFGVAGLAGMGSEGGGRNNHT